jgi:cyclophilin family peptidyl-prolyl cis-trans isomerase/HEAT repeat protein
MIKLSFRFVTPLLAASILFVSMPASAQKTKPAAPVSAGQLSIPVLIQIVKAEDERRWDSTLVMLLRSSSPAVRTRAALAAGRIGDEAAVPNLALLLEKDPDAGVRAMAVFALGETESAKAADAILKVLLNTQEDTNVRARAIEAAGKVAAANKPVAEKLGLGILHVLEAEWQNPMPNYQFVLLGLTSMLRAGPEKAKVEVVVANYLKDVDPRVRADAANTLARLKGKKANDLLQTLLSDNDPVVRANAARALGAAEDKTAYDLLLKAAADDDDLRVRVSAIRALGSLKDAKASEVLLERGGKLMDDLKRSKNTAPSEKNELLEIATTLGRILPNSKNESAIKFLIALAEADKYRSAETNIALAKIDPAAFPKYLLDRSEEKKSWQAVSAAAQSIAEWAGLEETKDYKTERNAVVKELRGYLGTPVPIPAISMPDILTAWAAFKPKDLDKGLRESLAGKDVFVRAAAAGLLAEQPASKENVEALKTAFSKAFLTDKLYDDAQLAILDALFKLDKKDSVGTLLIALNAPDYLVRKKAFELLKTPGMEKDSPGIPTILENAVAKKKNLVLPYSPAFGTKLGQVLNTTADYTRAVSRKNGRIKAVVTTEKGAFTIDLLPEDAPLTADNFIKLARANYFNGVMVHRVVPNFVMQDGDPRGDGNGGPGWSIRCEINMVQFDRGALGMALSGKDTGGSQWFVTHSPQPHLDGGYTVFGHVNDSDMKVVDMIARGDKIISIRIVEKIYRQEARR